MTASDQVARLLVDQVPLALLFDLAGYGPTAQELMAERPELRRLELRPSVLRYLDRIA